MPLDDTDIVPNNLAGQRTLLAVHSMFDLEWVVEKHSNLFPASDFIAFHNFISGCYITKNDDGPIPFVIEGILFFGTKLIKIMQIFNKIL